MFCTEVYQNGSMDSQFHIFSMAGALILNLLLIYVQFNQAEKDEIEKELLELKYQTDLERQNYQHIEAQREKLAKIRHDYNNQLSSVLGLLKTSNTQEAQKIIQSLLGKIEETREYPYCGIPIIDVILSEKEKECRTNGIKLYPEILLPEDVLDYKTPKESGVTCNGAVIINIQFSIPKDNKKIIKGEVKSEQRPAMCADVVLTGKRQFL